MADVPATVMRTRLILALFALIGITGAVVSQTLASRTTTRADQLKWIETRNRFFLLTSLSMNTLVLSTLYRYVRKRRATDDSKRKATA